MAKCWIFQANPKIFDIIGELKDSYNSSHWTIRQHSEDIRYGDTAFIWKADAGEGNAGIYAVAEVVSEVAPFSVIWGSQYWKNPNDIKVEQRVIIWYVKKLVHTPILKATLLADPVLKDLAIIKQPVGTVFEVTDRQCQELNKMLSSL